MAPLIQIHFKFQLALLWEIGNTLNSVRIFLHFSNIKSSCGRTSSTCPQPYTTCIRVIFDAGRKRPSSGARKTDYLADDFVVVFYSMCDWFCVFPSRASSDGLATVSLSA